MISAPSVKDKINFEPDHGRTTVPRQVPSLLKYLRKSYLIF